MVVKYIVQRWVSQDLIFCLTIFESSWPPSFNGSQVKAQKLMVNQYNPSQKKENNSKLFYINFNDP